jgi:putative ABC transport system permease protein
MLTYDIIDSAWHSLWNHRLRSVLSILGIVIGIGSFSLMYSMGEGARQATIKSIKELGADVLSVEGKAPSQQNPGFKSGRLSFKDIDALKRDCPSISIASPIVRGQASFNRRGNSKSFNVTGITTSHQKMFKLKAASGRLISDFDMEFQNQNCVVGSEVASSIFGDKTPLGQSIPIQGYQFKVIGTINDPDSMMVGMANIGSEILVPLPFVQRLFHSNDISTLYVTAEDTSKAISELRRFFQMRYGDNVLFDIQSQKQLLQTQEQFVKIFEYILWAISSISLMVGGIGILNIMLVSVTERLREIGIRRALGATQKSIMLQFMFESILLCVFGACGGTLMGFLGIKLISYILPKFTPVFSLKLLLVALGIASFIGVLFGTYPAVRAARQDPTSALRYD